MLALASTSAPGVTARFDRRVAPTSALRRSAFSRCANARGNPGVRAMASGVKGTKVIVQGRGMEITESIREYAEKKIEKAVTHFDQHDVREVDVRCSSRGGEKQQGGALQKTEVTLYTKNGILRAEEEGADLYASIDAVSDKIERKLRKLKEKKNTKRPAHNKNSTKETTAALTAAAAAADDALLEDDADVFVEVVREKFHTVKVCSVMEAADEMENLGHAFYAFRNKAQNDEMNVVYKRDAGGYGVIIPVDIESA
uniref:Sigma 54 modulation/S30EA ribosomal protein C-terminal domain-containing protein n=1 Tax=Mantoniella antarctica TaxID=81844 RepID=A0A7S0X2P0_9CHLO|mmetsp:Transcript_11507/g.27974  ORF Transcript_11507/g.27974 Transcript_11507/m.27974 type:complete len:256 (+) Transcript_11507:258-1025(+)